jgi:hypothetical protein
MFLVQGRPVVYLMDLTLFSFCRRTAFANTNRLLYISTFVAIVP